MDIIFVLLIIVLLQLRERTLNRNKLWLLPVLMLYISLSAFEKVNHVQMIDLLTIVTLTLIGLIIGGIRGSLYRISFDDQKQQLMKKGSVLTVVILLALIFAKVVIEKMTIIGNTEHLYSVIQAGFFFELFGSFAGRNLALWLRSGKLVKNDSVGE
jgi:hypothetical protein